MLDMNSRRRRSLRVSIYRMRVSADALLNACTLTRKTQVLPTINTSLCFSSFAP